MPKYKSLMENIKDLMKNGPSEGRCNYYAIFITDDGYCPGLDDEMWSMAASVADLYNYFEILRLLTSQYHDNNRLSKIICENLTYIRVYDFLNRLLWLQKPWMEETGFGRKKRKRKVDSLEKRSRTGENGEEKIVSFDPKRYGLNHIPLTAIGRILLTGKKEDLRLNFIEKIFDFLETCGLFVEDPRFPQLSVFIRKSADTAPFIIKKKSRLRCDMIRNDGTLEGNSVKLFGGGKFSGFIARQLLSGMDDEKIHTVDMTLCLSTNYLFVHKKKIDRFKEQMRRYQEQNLKVSVRDKLYEDEGFFPIACMYQHNFLVKKLMECGSFDRNVLSKWQ